MLMRFVIVCMSSTPEIIAAMRENDLLLITADHGNDPTYGTGTLVNIHNTALTLRGMCHSDICRYLLVWKLP